jgi:hypothetical protein
MMNGYGEFYWKDGKIYVGYYLNDKKEGFGIYYWPNLNRTYIGFWKDGKQDGIGKLINKGKVKYGQWINGEKIRQFDNANEAISLMSSDCLVFKKFFKVDEDKIIAFLNSGKNS